MRKTFAALSVLGALLLAACDTTDLAAVGTVQGRVTAWDAARGAIVVDRVAMLSGQEAVAAAREDGALPAGENSLPNDFYIDDLPGEPERLRVAADAEALVFDCSAGCELKPVAVDTLLRGEARPFNGDGALFEIRLRQGVVVGLAEIYVP